MRQFNRKHDVILFYSKGKQWTFNADAVRVPHRDGGPHQGGFAGGGKSANDPEYGRKGKIPETWWAQAPGNGLCVAPRIKGERTGYPTQKPLALYQRIIRASSNPGDIVFDPFAGCATTCVAAEAEGRQWVAADLWPGALRVTQERLETLARPAGAGETGGLKLYSVIARTDPLVRTDEGDVGAPPLKSVYRKQSAPTMRRAAILAALIERDRLQCQGCGFEPPRPEYLEVDHKLPRADGGSNDLENRVLLCGPCNRTKGARLTLTGLRDRNRKDGVMLAGAPRPPGRGKAKGG